MAGILQNKVTKWKIRLCEYIWSTVGLNPFSKALWRVDWYLFTQQGFITNKSNRKMNVLTNKLLLPAECRWCMAKNLSKHDNHNYCSIVSIWPSHVMYSSFQKNCFQRCSWYLSRRPLLLNNPRAAEQCFHFNILIQSAVYRVPKDHMFSLTTAITRTLTQSERFLLHKKGQVSSFQRTNKQAEPRALLCSGKRWVNVRRPLPATPTGKEMTIRLLWPPGTLQEPGRGSENPPWQGRPASQSQTSFPHPDIDWWEHFQGPKPWYIKVGFLWDHHYWFVCVS